MVGSLIQLAGLDWRAPHLRTFSRRQKDLRVAVPYGPSSGPLHLVIESTGLKVLAEGEWNVSKHGAGSAAECTSSSTRTATRCGRSR
jgi:hypothetical protein